MYILRNAVESDLDQILELSQLKVFINLPSDKKVLEEKIQNSLRSFNNPSPKLEDNIYVFVLEDINNNRILGVSMIHGKHGTEDEPHFYLTVAQENKYSNSLNTGFIHGTLKFGYNPDGYTEIGGLILEPGHRGSPFKLGKALSYSRFLYIAQNQNEFTDEIHVELMPPFDSNGNSPLWEAIGRKFLNMDYTEADVLSRKNKEFILSLFPPETIYETLLPLAARDSIGKVGRETLPVKRMLESIGFEYTQEVDPFDGGPHYRAKKEDITLLKEAVQYNLEFEDVRGKPAEDRKLFMINMPHKDFKFYTTILSARQEGNKLFVPQRFKAQCPATQGVGFNY